MERRHQVFISSTFTDLVDERREVIEALLEMDAIPAGMELFAAGNTDQWSLIEQVIDQSDYYIVIVGGRYGSTTAEGISYTEKEYDHALKRGIPVMGFVHGNPEDIPAGKSELKPEAVERLAAFRNKVRMKLVREYRSPSELGGVVSRGLHKLQRDFPRPGWVRGDHAMTPETEARIAEMRAEIAELRQAASERASTGASAPKIEGLASGDDTFHLNMELTGTSVEDRKKSSWERGTYVWTVGYATTWNRVLEVVGPSLMDEASETEMYDLLGGLGKDLVREQPDRIPQDILQRGATRLANSGAEDVRVQLFALGLIDHGEKKRTQSNQKRYWKLTNLGQDEVMRLRAIRRPNSDQLRTAREAELRTMTVAELRRLAKSFSLDHLGLKQDLIDRLLGHEHPA